MNWRDISAKIEASTGRPFYVESAHAIAGGDINSAYRIMGKGNCYFVKLNRKDLISMFEAEFDGLQEMAESRTVSVPFPIMSGITGDNSYLVLENINFGISTQASSRLLGQQLAQMHRVSQPHFGWHRNNTIGSTPQINQQSDNWSEFWRDQRLEYQLRLARQNGFSGRLQNDGQRLLCNLENFFADYKPHPSLLHGDLWGGNSAVDHQGQPFIFDPACYYGDREADLAMTELFGGYSRDFYAAYQDVWPLNEGYKVRKTLYNLYHILNHLNLFGGGYIRQAENMISQLLAEC